MNYFGLIKQPKIVMYIDATLFAVGGLGHLIPAMLAGILGYSIFGLFTVQMLAGALMVARAIDMLFFKK